MTSDDEHDAEEETSSGARAPAEIARRCVCLELLHQRFLLESTTVGEGGSVEVAADPIEEREKARVMWVGRLGDLGVADLVLPEERALLDKAVGSLDEDALDDVHGRATGALILLWALGRLETRPTFETVETMDEVLADHGLLGDGSITRTKEAIVESKVRTEQEIDNARLSYLRTRGKAKEVEEPNRIFAEVAVHHLEWITDPAAEDS